MTRIHFGSSFLHWAFCLIFLPFWYQYHHHTMAFADIMRRFVIYIDGDDNDAMWIHDRDDERRWTKSEVAVQLLKAIAAYDVAYVPPPPVQPPPPPGPPPPLNAIVAHVGRTTPQPPLGPPPPLCQRHRHHAISMFNGMPWESQQSIGRDLTRLNWISPSASTCQSWMQRLFHNTHSSSSGAGFEAAVLASAGLGMEWAWMATHKARYIGIASRCRCCHKICRIAWTLSSTAQHMRTQRAHILSWLNLPYEMPWQEESDAVPIV